MTRLPLRPGRRCKVRPLRTTSTGAVELAPSSDSPSPKCPRNDRGPFSFLSFLLAASIPPQARTKGCGLPGRLVVPLPRRGEVIQRSRGPLNASYHISATTPGGGASMIAGRMDAANRRSRESGRPRRQSGPRCNPNRRPLPSGEILRLPTKNLPPGQGDKRLRRAARCAGHAAASGEPPTAGRTPVIVPASRPSFSPRL